MTRRKVHRAGIETILEVRKRTGDDDRVGVRDLLELAERDEVRRLVKRVDAGLIAEAEGRVDAIAHGPPPMTTADEVERIRRRLVEDERPAGERSIAKEIGVSRDAVRYALGKDRRATR